MIMSSLCKYYFIGYLLKDLTKRSAVSTSFFITICIGMSLYWDIHMHVPHEGLNHIFASGKHV